MFSGQVRALEDVTLEIDQGDIVGLVGESGSGKTTLCRVLVGLTPPTSGSVSVGGETVARQLASQPLAFRRRVQMLLQDAVASLSPRMTIGRTLREPIAIHSLPRAPAEQRLAAILQRLGLPADVTAKYPHQISGGQARRVGVARALVMQPELIVADEPTAGLDVSVQGELLNLLLDLQQEFSLTYLLVSHNLNVIRRVTRRTAVMYLGQIVEQAPTQALFERPAHPYSAALLSTNPGDRPGEAGAAHRVAGRDPQRGQPAAGLPLPHPLPGGAGTLQDRRAGARGGGRGAPGALPFPVFAEFAALRTRMKPALCMFRPDGGIAEGRIEVRDAAVEYGGRARVDQLDLAIGVQQVGRRRMGVLPPWLGVSP